MGLFRHKKAKVEPLPPNADYEYTYELQVAGVSIGGEYGERQLAIDGLYRGFPLDLVREPDNRHDRNAVAVYARGRQLGYVPAFKSEMAADYLDKGHTVDARVLEITSWIDNRERVLLGVAMWLGFKR